MFITEIEYVFINVVPEVKPRAERAKHSYLNALAMGGFCIFY